MGSNSNRSESKDEMIGRFAKEISGHKDNRSASFETSIGAEIRGCIGIEKGNEFINAIRKAND